MPAQLSSTSNKGFLWNLMVEAGVFGGVLPDKKQYVVEIFEQVIKEVEYNNTGSLIEMNKTAIIRVNSRLDPLREQQQQKPSTEPPKLVTAAEISSNRQEHFADNLSERQRNFDDMMVSKKPDDIDFSDKSVEDQPIGTEIDDMLANMMTIREEQLNHVMKSQDTNAAQTWINNDSSGSNAGPPTLQIGEVVSKPNIEKVKAKQKVTFVEDTPEDNDILSLFKVKKKEIDREVLIEKINHLESRVSELSSMIEDIKIALH